MVQFGLSDWSTVEVDQELPLLIILLVQHPILYPDQLLNWSNRKSNLDLLELFSCWLNDECFDILLLSAPVLREGTFLQLLLRNDIPNIFHAYF